MRRSSRSGSLVSTPDHQSKTMPVGTLFSLDDVAEPSIELDSSVSNSSSSFDTPPDVMNI